ncbi:hypothetical protein V6N11_072215 [Hibiscus sabdariffa]|uniref:Uncharacterized protein n=1 Tax=Hibiscus sabdariffa TaxID=183260 RepID=A0ABR2U2D1_9ROSI
MYEIPNSGGRVKKAYSEVLDKQQILLGCYSRTHEQLDLQSSSIKSSSHEMNTFVSQFPEITHKVDKPGENHNFDFGLLESVVSTTVSSRSLRSSPK